MNLHKIMVELNERFRRRNPMIPPKFVSKINDGDAEIIGKEFLDYFVQLGGLSKDAHVLDVGSGFGRMAVPLTGYLSEEARYEGLEILSKGVSWCQRKISTRFENFNFRALDVKNGRYNPKGKVLASDYKFPFDNEIFDFVILTSVFTHMLPADVENYLSEISRVLKPEGKCFITYFLLTSEVSNLIDVGKSQFGLKYSYEDCRIESEQDPEHVVAYPEGKLINWYKKYQLKVSSIYSGSWCGRKEYTSFQDIVIAEKVN